MKTQSSMVHVRMDTEMKRKATKALAAMGLTASEAVRLLFHHVPSRADLIVTIGFTGFGGRVPAVRFPPIGFQPRGLRRLRIACLSWASSGCW